MLIAQNDDLEAIYLDGQGDTLIVTFSHMDFPSDGVRFAADRALGKLGLPALGIVCRRNNWFPAHAFADLSERLQRVCQRFSKRVGYGFSMGAYGAIKYSRELDLTSTLSFSPQWSIDPSQAPWETRYSKHFTESNRGMEISSSDCSGNIMLFLDDMLDRDLKHVQQIERAYPCQRITMRYCGHDTLPVVASTETIGSLLRAAADGDIAEVARITKERKKESAPYRVALMKARAEALRQRGNNRQSDIQPGREPV